jgi:hypothetical protein
MTTNNKISTLISSQLPAFIRDDSSLFTAFMEAYYEYMEQSIANDTGARGDGKVIEKLKNLYSVRNIETSLEDFTNQLYSEFLHLLPMREYDGSNTSNGNIIGTNYMKYSNNFDLGFWGTTNLTVTPNDETFIDGTQTATKFLETVTSGQHALYTTAIKRPSNTALTLSFYIKPYGRTAGYLQMKDTGGGLDGPGLYFNLGSSIVTFGSNIGTGTYISNTITALSNGWYRMSLTGNTTIANSNLVVALFTDDIYSGTVSHVGDTSTGFLLKGFQLESNTIATTYTPTYNLQIDTATGIYTPVYTYDYPKALATDYRKLLPRIKNFYRSRGTEKSYRFLMRMLSNGGDSDVLYPKDHILKASDGKWFVQRSLRVTDTRMNDVLDPSFSTFTKYEGRRLVGLSSNTTAIVERTEQFYELGTLINEIFLSSISNTFISGETVQSQYYDSSNNNNLVTLSSNIFSGLVTSVTIIDGGTGYAVGNPVSFTGGGGSGAVGVVSSVSTGNISSLVVARGGSGYKSENLLLFTGGGGSGANGDVLSTNTSGAFHPNTYNIDANQISQIQEANWRAAQTVFAITTSNLALNTINSLSSTFVYDNCGPVTVVRVTSPGDGYTSLPSISVIANTTISVLGILGSLIINNGGTNYLTGDELVFTNPVGGYGFGAKANVFTVNGTGAITGVRYYSNDGEIKGGMGYFDPYLPTITVTSGSGSGANITAASQIGSGAAITPATGQIGTILSIQMTSGGQGYDVAPSVILTDYGDGTANATATVVQGVYTYPGYFLNQDGFPSAYNYLQNRDYWQNYSYVVRVGLAYEKWIQAVNDLVHPLGTKVFGDYVLINSELAKPNSVTGNDSLYVAQQYTGANSTYFDGNTYMKAMNETFWFGTPTGGILWSGWFKMMKYLDDSNSEMTIHDMSTSNGDISRIKVVVKKAPYIIGRNDMWSSEWFDDVSVWAHGVLLTANNGYDESNNKTMTKFNEAALNQEQKIRQVVTYGSNIRTGATVTASIYAKPAEREFLFIRILDSIATTDGAGACFNLNAATFNVMTTVSGVYGNGKNFMANIQSVGNGVYRTSLTVTPNNTTQGVLVDYFLYSNTLQTSYLGDGTSGMWINKAQLEPTDMRLYGNGTTGNASVYAGPTGNAGIVGTRPYYTYGDPNNNPSGTGHYAMIRIANSTNFGTLTIKTDEIRNPLQTNVWYHLIMSANVQFPLGQNMFLNNVNSSIVISKSANTNERIEWIATNVSSIGANTAGGNTFNGYIAEVWTGWFSSIWDPASWTSRNDWIAPPLLPNANLGANGFNWTFPALPTFYMRSNTALGNTNSGSGVQYRVFGTSNTVGLLPGPGSNLIV